MQIRSLYRKFIFTFSCSYPNTRFCFIKVTRPRRLKLIYRECSSVNIGFRYSRFTPEHSFLAPKFAASDFWRGYAIPSLSLQKAKTYPLISLTLKKMFLQFCYLTLYLGNETVSCGLLLRMVR